ncbi:MAG: hypothetical protein ACI9R3_001373 [Verrucomicrobiales bacterium]|jgi:hypothetical protein
MNQNRRGDLLGKLVSQDTSGTSPNSSARNHHKKAGLRLLGAPLRKTWLGNSPKLATTSQKETKSTQAKETNSGGLGNR